MSFEDDLPPLLRGAIEAGHHEMQIRRQRLHHSHLARLCADNVRHIGLQVGVDIQPCREIGIADFLEMAVDAFACPGAEVLLEVRSGEFGLQA